MADHSDEHKENFECLKAHYINQQEAYQSLQDQYTTLSEQYEQLHTKSQEIITTLQEERDQKSTECETLRSQVLSTQQLEQMKLDWLEKVEQHMRKNTEDGQNELETVRGEYNKLVCSYTFLKSEYESALVCHQCQLQDLKAEHETVVSSFAEKLKLAQEENETVFKVKQIRQLQKINSELEQKVKTIESELEEMQTKHASEVCQRDKVIEEQAERLENSQTQIKTLEAECYTLSSSLESIRAEQSQCFEKQCALQAALEQAQRENHRAHRELEERNAKHKVQLHDMEIKMKGEYQKIKECQDGVVREKQSYESQLELLQETLQEYETLLASKGQELEAQIQAARHSEWEKRVTVERENMALGEKITELERLRRTAENENRSQCAKLQDQILELSTKNMSLEAKAELLKTELQQRNENDRKAEMELHFVQEMGYKKEYQLLQSQYQKLQEAKQKVESNCLKLQSTICALEQVVSDARKEIICVTQTHQHTIDHERQTWQEEKAKLLSHIEKEEIHVKGLMNDIEVEKIRSKKIQRHLKKKFLDLKDAAEISQAKQIQVETERDSLKKSLSLENVKLKNELSKLKRRHNEFCVLLQTDYSGLGHPISRQEHLPQSFEEVGGVLRPQD